MQLSHSSPEIKNNSRITLERINTLYGETKKILDNFLSEKMSRELLISTIKLSKMINMLELKSKFTKDFSVNYFHELKGLASLINNIILDIDLAEKIMEIENLIMLYIHDVEAERRENYRFVIASEGRLEENGVVYDIFVNDISANGVQFCIPVMLEANREYVMKMFFDEEKEFVLSPVRHEEFGFSENALFKTGASFAKPLSKDEMNEIILYSIRRKMMV